MTVDLHELVALYLHQARALVSRSVFFAIFSKVAGAAHGTIFATPVTKIRFRGILTPKRRSHHATWRQVKVYREAETQGGNKSGSGRGKPDTHVSSKKGGKLGGAAAAARPAAKRSASAKKAAATRKRNKTSKAKS
jgi:hypothetical protein